MKTKCFESKLRFTRRNVSKTLHHNLYILSSTKPIKPVRYFENSPFEGRIFDKDFHFAKFSCFCFLYELPTNKPTSLVSWHTLKPTDISGSTKHVTMVERVKCSPYKTESSVDFHNEPSISHFSLALANFSCFCFWHDYQQIKRPPHSLSRSQHGTLSNQLISRVLKRV